MELVILSTLQWKMNPITPISVVDHFARRFELMINLHYEFLRRCESLILAIIPECRLVRFRPSIIAAAVKLRVIREMEANNALDYENQLVSLLRAMVEEIHDCDMLIDEAMSDLNHNPYKKHKCERSPSGVIDAYFRSDSSVDSWPVAPCHHRLLLVLKQGTSLHTTTIDSPNSLLDNVVFIFHLHAADNRLNPRIPIVWRKTTNICCSHGSNPTVTKMDLHEP